MPAASYALALKVTFLFGQVVVFHDTWKGAVVAVPTSVVSAKKATFVTPTLSVAVAASVTVPETLLPFGGAVIVADGGVVSGPPVPFATVTAMAVDAVWPAASVARAEIVWLPFVVAPTFHRYEIVPVFVVATATPSM